MNLTIKQEKFCKKYIETGNASEAYRQCYNAGNMKPETINVKSAELLKNGKVAVRIEALQEKLQEVHEFTVGDALKEFEQARLLAMNTENASAMVSATTGKSRLFGLDQTKITGSTKVIVKDFTGVNVDS